MDTLKIDEKNELVVYSDGILIIEEDIIIRDKHLLIDGRVELRGNLEISNNLTITSDAAVDGEIYVGGNVDVGDYLICGKRATICGNADIGGFISGKGYPIEIGGNLIAFEGVHTFSPLIVSGDLIVHDKITTGSLKCKRLFYTYGNGMMPPEIYGSTEIDQLCFSEEYKSDWENRLNIKIDKMDWDNPEWVVWFKNIAKQAYHDGNNLFGFCSNDEWIAKYLLQE